MNNSNYYLGNGWGWPTALMSCCTALVLMVVYIFVCTCIIQWLWNAIVVVKFGAPELTFWETFGLAVMLRLIFPPAINKSKSN